MDSPEQWRWLWLAAAAVFAIGEMATPGSFFLAPFAVGAFVAAMLAFAGVSVTVEWLVFVVVSVVVLALLRPLARRLDREALDHGVGSRRMVGRQATVLADIPPGDEIGMVRVDREQWRAQSIDGAPIAAGAAVRIADVQGTRVIVAPLDSAAVAAPPPSLSTPTRTDDTDPAPAGASAPDRGPQPAPPEPTTNTEPGTPADPAPAGASPTDRGPEPADLPAPTPPAPAAGTEPGPTGPAADVRPDPDTPSS
ncbi:MAG TPA: NfeD family protein [Acidimicrobiales bacterium]|nr:NfeD family protein [Acidimicrobiales bacterium]